MPDVSLSGRERENRLCYQLVSEAAQEDGPATEPRYHKAYDLEPPAVLADLQLFTNGHPLQAYKTLREKAPVCWHGEAYQHAPHGPGFWAVTRYADVRAVELDTKHSHHKRAALTSPTASLKRATP